MSVTMNDFQKLILKVGKVVGAERIPGKTKILKANVDVGDRVLQVVVGGAEYYQPEYFVGRRVVVLTNMEPRVIGGVRSEGMLLAADRHGKPIWLTTEEEVPPGAIVR